MNCIKNFKKYARRTFFFWLGLFLVFSCRENELEQHTVHRETQLSLELKTDYEKKLVHLSTYFGMILNDKDAMKELFDLAQAEGNVGDIEYSLRRLFEDKENPVSKNNSAIVSAFSRSSVSNRLSNEGVNPDDFISFINANDIEILAPYLARNFNSSDVTELTISWWTKEMEEMALAKNPDWPGETPAFKINLSSSENYYSAILNAINSGSIEVFMVSDEYAMKNPTIVLGAFGEDLYNMAAKANENENSESERVKQYFNIVPKEAGIKCTDILPNDIVRYNMPEFRILDNTRSWPNGNFISIYVAFASYSIQSGVPVPGFSNNQIANEKKINRGDFSWKSNFTGPLVTHWHESNISIQVVFAYMKKNVTATQTVVSTATNPTTGATVSSSTTFTINDARVYGSQTWFRCAEINGAHTIPAPPVNLLRAGNAIWQLSGNGNRCQFTLEPRLTRF